MFELPEVMTLARQMREALVGRTIARADVTPNRPRFLFLTPEPPAFQGALRGRTIRDVTSRGKWILTRLDGDGTFLIGEFGGRLLLRERGADPSKPPHVLVAFEGGQTLTLTIQMWAFLGVLTEDEIGVHPVAGKLGPSPLDPDFTVDRLGEVLARTAASEDVPIKAFLTHEANVSGIGNGYLQDILWNAHLSPRRRVSSLTHEDRAALHKAMRDTLRRAADLDGRDTERDLHDRPGRYVPVLDRRAVGLPCPACGTPIGKISYLGGSCYLCPTCQR